MSSVMRMLGLASRVYGTRAHHLAQYRRTLVANCVQSPLRSFSSSMTAANVKTRYNLATKFRDDHQTARNPLDETLSNMDLYARRAGRVNIVSVHEAIKHGQAQGQLNSTQMAQLLRATGVYLRECSPEIRSALTEVVWKLADRQNLDVSHYNILLQVYLENGMSFEPQAFLVQMKDAQIAPNRVTYQRLIQRFCDLGDTAGATKVLEFMKSEQLPVSERVFNALIKGHLLAGDEASARKIIEVMGNSGLTPTGDTYTALACGFAETGESEKALQAMDNCYLTDEQVLRVAKSFALKDNLESMQAAVYRMPRAVGFAQDVINSCMELLALKNLPAAKIVFNTIPFDPSKAPSGNFFIAQMVRCGIPLSDVTAFCRELKEKEMNNGALLTAIETSLKSADRTTALQYIELMPELGFNLRAHFFYPILCKATNEAEVLETLRGIVDIEGGVSDDTLTEFVLPRFSFNQPSEVVHKLVDAGCTLTTSANACARYLLRNEELEKCYRLLADADRCPLNRNLVKLTAKAVTPNNVDLCVEILKRIVQSPSQVRYEQAENDPVGSFLAAIPTEAFRPTVSAVARERLQIGQTQFDQLLNQNPAVRELSANVVADEQLGSTSSTRPGWERWTLAELEEQLAVLERRDEDTRAAVSRLLVAYWREKNVDKAEEMLQKLEGKKLSAGVLASLIELNVFKGDLETALKFYDETQRKNIVIDDNKVISLAALAAREGKLAEAKEMLSKHTFNEAAEQRQRNAARLVDATVNKYGVEEAFKMVDEYVAKFTPLTASVLLPIVKHVLDKGDVSASFELFKDIASRYKVTPLKRELCLKLIAENDVEKLDVVTNISAERYGEFNAHVDLALVYIERGDMEKARALLQELPLRTPQRRVEYICEQIVDRKDIEMLTAFASLLAEVGYDKDYLYHQLIRGYCRADDLDKALEQWTKAQEENLILSNRTIRYLAQMLERNGREVPFVVPNEFDDQWQTAQSANDAEQQFLKILRKSVDQALAFRQAAAEKGQPLRMLEESELISVLIENNQLDQAFKILKETLQRYSDKGQYPRPRTVRFLLSSMAQEGMVDEIKSLDPLLNSDLYKLFTFHDVLCKAYVCANRVSEYLDILDKVPATVSIGHGWTDTVLEKQPESLGRIMGTAKRFVREANNYMLLNSVWMRLFADGKYAEADALLAENPQMLEHESLQVNKILTRVRETGDVAMSERLLGILKDSKAKRIHAIVLSQHVNLLVAKGLVEEAQDRLKQECAEGVNINQCNFRALENLRKELLLLGKEAEFELPQRGYSA